MKNNLVVIRFVVLLSTALYVRCETKKFCKALAENEGRISYAISVPRSSNETNKHRFYVVIKDHYWEILMIDLQWSEPTYPEVSSEETVIPETSTIEPQVAPPLIPEPTPSTTGTGLKLMMDWGIKFDFSSVESQMGFAVRMGETANNAFIFISDEWEKYRWYERPQSKEGLPDIEEKETLNTSDFGTFSPSVGYNPYSNRDNNHIILIQQFPLNDSEVSLGYQFRIYEIKNLSHWNIENIKVEERPAKREVKDEKYPKALDGLCRRYYIRGLFGYEARRVVTRSGVTDTDIVPSMVLLIEECESGYNCTNPTYKYCASPEVHEDPFALHCNKTTLKTLFECPKGDPEGEGEVPNPDAESDGNTSGSTVESSESSKSWLWIILILIIIFIIIIIILLLFCCKGKGEDKPTGETPASAPKSSAAKPGAGTGNNESMATSSKISTRTNPDLTSTPTPK